MPRVRRDSFDLSDDSDHRSDDDGNVPPTLQPFTPEPRRQLRDLVDQTAGLALGDTPRVPGAPSSSRTKHTMRTRPDALPPPRPATEILLEHLMHCPAKKKYAARLNKAAEREGFDHIKWESYPWSAKGARDDEWIEELFVKAVTRQSSEVAAGRIAPWGLVGYRPQVHKDLYAEGDVTAAVLSNVLNPLVEIFNLFIDRDKVHQLHCVIRSQHFTNGSHLDHIIKLEEMHPPHGQLPGLSIPLVTVEDKAPGIVRQRDFLHSRKHTQNSDDNWMKKLLPQLFLYAHRVEPLSATTQRPHAAWSRSFLTNYSETVAVRVKMDELNVAVEDLEARGKKACKKTVSIEACSATDEWPGETDEYKEPCEWGFRMGLAAEVFLALMDLGIANLELVSKKLDQSTVQRVRADITQFLETYKSTHRRPSESPSRLGYDEAPPSPR